MSTFYDIDFNRQAIELLPPDKRVQPNIGLFQAFLSPLQWLRDLLFTSYLFGSKAPDYAPGSYNQYDQIIFNKQVYSSLKNNNTDLPTNQTSWKLIQNNFLGVNERVLFNGQKLVLEFALNQEFETTFRQPPLISDIYVSNESATLVGFIVGVTKGSTVGNKESSADVGYSFIFEQTLNFVIFIPSAVYAKISDQQVRDFVNPIIPISLNYTVQTY